MSRTCATPLCKGRPEKLDAWGNDVCAPCWRADHGLRATRGDPSEVPPTPRDAAPPPPYRPPETPVPATAPTSAPSSTPPSAPSPVAAGVGGGASSRARRCRWPGHGDVKHLAYGFCQRDIARVKSIGLNPAEVRDEDLADVVARWEARNAEVDAARTKRLLANRPARPRKAAKAAAVAEGADPRDARIAELERQLAETDAKRTAAEEMLSAADRAFSDLRARAETAEAAGKAASDVLDLAGVPREGTPAERVHRLAARAERAEALGRCLDGVLFGGIDRPPSFEKLSTEDRRLVVAATTHKRSVAAIAEMLDRVEAPSTEGDHDLPLDARVAWLTDELRLGDTERERAQEARAKAEAQIFAAAEALTAAGVTPTGTLAERVGALAGDATTAAAKLTAVHEELGAAGACAMADPTDAAACVRALGKARDRAEASLAETRAEPAEVLSARVPAVARPVDVSRELVIFAALLESVEADMLAVADPAIRARLGPLFRALRALGGLA